MQTDSLCLDHIHGVTGIISSFRNNSDYVFVLSIDFNENKIAKQSDKIKLSIP